VVPAGERFSYRDAIWSDLQKKGWTKADLAINSGLQPSLLTRFFKGTELDVPTLAIIAKALGREPGDFLSRSDVDPRLKALEPLLKAMKDLSAPEESEVVQILARQVDVMAKWRGRGSKMASSVTPSVKPGEPNASPDEQIEPSTSR